MNNRSVMCVIILWLNVLFADNILSQQNIVYNVPFQSQNNIIELSIENGSPNTISNISIEPEELPKWLHISPSEHIISSLKEGEEKSIQFNLSVDKHAPVNQEQIISFNIITTDGNRWQKEITISIEKPKEFKLFQNFPNPFNPTTTIGFQLPQDGKVKLNIFNLLGQEVATLIDDDLSAGYHEKIWNAEDNSSGVYIYQLVISNQSGYRAVDRKKVMLIK